MMGNKSTTTDAAPIFQPDTGFPKVGNATQERRSSPGLFQLGQLVGIKDRADAKAHHPEQTGVLIDSRDGHNTLVWNEDEGCVVLVPHSHVATPVSLYPQTEEEAIKSARALIRKVQALKESKKAAAVVAMEEESAFPEVQIAAGELDNADGDDVSMGEISSSQEDELLKRSSRA
jgi:hypothetical protein